MVKFMQKVPAGTFLFPMLLSALIYTFFPGIFNIGGVTEAFLGGDHTTFLIAMITFFSGVGLDVKGLGKLFKRHGVLFIVKLILAIGLSFLYMNLFGQEGILGINAMAFTIVMSSINPALYLSLVGSYGEDIDTGAFGITSIFAIPMLPLFIYSFQGGGEFDWMPILSTLIPFFVGMFLGNIDKDFNDIFKGGIAAVVPLLGWKVGYGLNLLDALQASLVGIVLVIIFYVIMSLMVVTDTLVLKNDGVAAGSMLGVANASSAFPAMIAASVPAAQPYVSDATAQILATAIITILVTPILVNKLYEKAHGQDDKKQKQQKA